MANILLTMQHNRSCPRCVAKSEVADAAPDSRMSWENLIYVADFLERSGRQHVSLGGGEPTLHPDCVDFILYLLHRRFRVEVFTHGLLSPARLEEFRAHLASADVEQLDFNCDLNDPEQTPAPAKELERVREFLAVMGPWTVAGFNIYRPDFSLDFLFDAVNRFGMKRRLRVGIAHPVPGQSAAFVRSEQLPEILDRLFSFRRQFDAFRVQLSLDCGFPICKVTDEQLGWLHRSGGEARFGCGPAMEITSDMSVYYCSPLAGYRKRSLFEFDSVQQVEDYFAALRGPLTCEVPGIYDECDGCRQRADGVCAGGGLCHALDRMVREAPIRNPEVENELAHLRLPI
jgi:hypothetical protein